MILRPYQQQAIDDVRALFAAGHRAVCLQMPTGAGKTATAARLIQLSVARGKRPLFLARLDALIDDTAARLTAAGLRVGVIQADRPADPDAAVQVCSLQTLHARGVRPASDFLILDECHNAMATTVRGVLADYPTARLLGLTATPQRGDGQPLGDVFSALATGPTVAALTALGHLVPCDVIAPPSFEDRGLTTTPIVAYQAHAPGTRAIVFASNVAHAEAVTRDFASAGVSAECITGDTPRAKRRSVRARLASGETLALVGVGVFIEGFDEPTLETVILARAFSVTGSFLQAIGRGLRPSLATGKRSCTVIDLRGSVHLHGLPDEARRWSLTGEAVVRTEALTALARCAACLAIFRPASRCPRCGDATAHAAKIPRNLNRAEKLERLSGLSQYERDRRYLASLERIARERIRLSDARAAAWAARAFEKKFNRKPPAPATRAA